MMKSGTRRLSLTTGWRSACSSVGVGSRTSSTVNPVPRKVRKCVDSKRQINALGYTNRDWVHHKDFLESESPRIKGMVAHSRPLGLS